MLRKLEQAGRTPTLWRWVHNRSRGGMSFCLDSLARLTIGDGFLWSGQCKPGLGRVQNCARCASEPGAGQKFSLGALQNRGLGKDSRVVHSGASVAAVSFDWCTRFRATVHQSKIPAQRNRTQRAARKFPSDAVRCTAPAVKSRRVSNHAVHQAKTFTLRHTRG